MSNIKIQNEKDNKILESQIDRVVIRLQEIQRLINLLDKNISEIEIAIQQEEVKSNANAERLKRYRSAIVSNVQLLNEFYNTYQKFEETIFKYRKQIAENNFNYLRLEEVQIRQLDDKANKADDSTLITLLQKLTDLTQQKNNLFTEITADLDNDPKYKL